MLGGNRRYLGDRQKIERKRMTYMGSVSEKLLRARDDVGRILCTRDIADTESACVQSECIKHLTQIGGHTLRWGEVPLRKA